MSLKMDMSLKKKLIKLCRNVNLSFNMDKVASIFEFFTAYEDVYLEKYNSSNTKTTLKFHVKIKKFWKYFCINAYNNKIEIEVMSCYHGKKYFKRIYKYPYPKIKRKFIIKQQKLCSNIYYCETNFGDRSGCISKNGKCPF